jgi:hypothetical protein
MDSTNRKKLRGVPQPFEHRTNPHQFKPAVLQSKTPGPNQSKKGPVAPAAYQVRAQPSIAQLKTSRSLGGRTSPVAPPIYRPQPLAKVLQKKKAHQLATETQTGTRNEPGKRPVAPPPYRPQDTPKVLQRKTNQQRAAPALGNERRDSTGLRAFREKKVTGSRHGFGPEPRQRAFGGPVSNNPIQTKYRANLVSAPAAIDNVKNMTRTVAGWNALASNRGAGRAMLNSLSQRSAIQRSKAKVATVKKESDKDKKSAPAKTKDNDSKEKPAKTATKKNLTDEEILALEIQAAMEAEEQEENHTKLKADLKASIVKEHQKGNYLPLTWTDFDKVMSTFADEVLELRILHDYKARAPVEASALKSATKLFKEPPPPGSRDWFLALMKGGGTIVYKNNYYSRYEKWTFSYGKSYTIKNNLGANTAYVVHAHWAGDKESDMRIVYSSIKERANEGGEKASMIDRHDLDKRLPLTANESFKRPGVSDKK